VELPLGFLLADVELAGFFGHRVLLVECLEAAVGSAGDFQGEMLSSE
jgi:hypothetical protein